MNSARNRPTRTRDDRNKQVSEYGAWRDMRRRCLSPDRPDYKLYGARGITVCDRWMNSYAAFLADMGPKPSPLHSLDRIDNDRGYEPCNCRWATGREQMASRRITRRLVVNGVERPLMDWAREVGLSRETLVARLDQLGWSVERAVLTPKRVYGHVESSR